MAEEDDLHCMIEAKDEQGHEMAAATRAMVITALRMSPRNSQANLY